MGHDALSTLTIQQRLAARACQNLSGPTHALLKLNREFDLASSGATAILLDFDAEQSVKPTGNGNGRGNGSGKYIMTPVIGIVSVQ